MKPDVIIIGTGPGGGMAACRLAESGRNVLILEKSKLPRHKPCGGAMPSRVTGLCDWDLAPLIEAKVWHQKFLNNYTQPITFEKKSDEPMIMVSRQRFDHHFVERALSLGPHTVELREGFAVESVEEDSHGVTVRGKNQEVLRADYVIAGDGASSRTARSLGLPRTGHIGAAVDVEIEVVPEVYEEESRRATFNLFCLPFGYGWIFPKAGYLSCGVAAWREPEGLPRQMNSYLEKSLPPNSITAIRQYGHPVPLYGGEQEIATKRVCLVGDAAWLVDPILGEGIYYAMQSGGLAAEVILNLFMMADSPRDLDRLTISERFRPNGTLDNALFRALFFLNRDCQAYQKIVRHTIGQSLRKPLRNFRSFLDVPELFYRRHFHPAEQTLFSAGEKTATY